jgi:hypothetical protein
MVTTKTITVEQGADFSTKLNWLLRKIPISGITSGSPTVISTGIPHRLSNGDKIILRETTTYPGINNNYQVTVISPNTFSITQSTSEVSITESRDSLEKETNWPEPYYGFIGIPNNLTGYSWSAKVSNNYSNSGGIEGVVGSVALGSNQVLLNTTSNNLDIEVGDLITVVGSGITNQPVKSIAKTPYRLNAVLEFFVTATSTVANTKVSRTSGTIAQFLIETTDDYGEIVISLPASTTSQIPIEGDRKYFWDLFGTTTEGSKIKLIKGTLEINPSVL